MILRRQALVSGLALATSRLPVSALTLVPPLPALTADDFRNSRLRGMGYGTLRNGDRPAADHNALEALGANHVRLFVEVERDGNSESYRVAPAQWASLESIVAALEQRGIYTVLVASFGPDSRDALWRSEALQESAIAIWRTMAQRLRGRSAIAGFDLVNEPVPPGITYAARQDRWLAFAGRLIDAIRTVDATRVAIVESAPDATPESFDNMRPLSQKGVVYSVHSYIPWDFTHQGVMAEYATPRRYPDIGADGKSSAVALAESLEHVGRFARRSDVPIYVGEFSAPRWAPDQSTARYIADSVAMFRRLGWSWAYHEFRSWNGWDAEIASPRREDGQRSADAPVLKVLRDGMRSVSTDPLSSTEIRR